MNDLLTTPDVKRLTEPAKRWFNWWLAKWTVDCVHCGAFACAGEVYSNVCEHCGDGPFASRDLAETAAANAIVLGSEYIGAFPEGERP